MPLIFRPARAVDLPQANELVVRSMNDLCERHGFGPMGTVRPPKFALFSLADDPDGLWLAEEAGEIRGFGFSWVCDDLWFLAQLFVAPARQTGGIGGELLKRTLLQAQKARATTRALVTFSFNAVSQRLYMRHGLYPRFPIYFFKTAREAVAGRVQGPQLRHAPIEQSHLDLLERIDTQALGVPRKKHHRYLLEDAETKGVMLFAGGDQCVGYAYLADGHIGPLAVTDPALAGAFMLRPGWMNRYLPPIAIEVVPDVAYTFGFARAGLMFASAALNAALALSLSPLTWSVTISVWGVASKLALLLAQFATMRMIGLSRRRATAGSFR